MPAMSSRWVALGLVLMACSDGSRAVTGEECRQITGRLAGWGRDSPLPASFAHRSVLPSDDDLRLAAVDSARPMPRHEWVDQDNLALLSRDDLPPRPLYVAAGSDYPMARLEGLFRDAKPAGALRLLVVAPAEARAALHLRAYPDTPAAAADLIRGMKGTDQRESLWNDVEAAGRGCAGVARVLELIEMGAGADVVGPGMAEALAECRCSVGNIDAFESLLAFAIVPNGDLGWLPLRYERGAPPLPGLTATSSVGELVAALARRPADQQDRPIGYAAITDLTPQAPPRTLDFPPPPPPPPPPPGPAGRPQIVPQVQLEAQRISGEKQVVPDAATRAEITKSGKNQIVGSFKMCLSAAGAVSEVTKMKSTGFPRYDKAIIDAMRSWKYRPFMVHGVATPVCSAVTFIYKQT
jgi:hypothetical protein